MQRESVFDCVCLIVRPRPCHKSIATLYLQRRKQLLLSVMKIGCRWCAIILLIIAVIVVFGHSTVESSNEENTVAISTLISPEECQHESARRVSAGDKIIIHYIGRFHNSGAHGPAGTIFETTRKKGKKPLKLTIGSPTMIAGLSEGVIGMCVGERRKLIIPPSLGYGNKGNPRMKIIGNTVLEFEVDFLGYQGEPKPLPNIFKEMDTNSDYLIQYDEMEKWFQTKHPKKLPSIPRDVWERDDVNQDKVITWDEFSGPKGEEEKVTRSEF